jgi:hypothetical protein
MRIACYARYSSDLQHGTSIKPFVPERQHIRHELANLAGLLSESADRARPVLRQLNLQVMLFPIHPEGERPHLKAVATCALDALTGEFPIVRRSLVRADGRRPLLLKHSSRPFQAAMTSPPSVCAGARGACSWRFAM